LQKNNSNLCIRPAPLLRTRISPHSCPVSEAKSGLRSAPRFAQSVTRACELGSELV
jgi:hypothetical protein